ncbi:MAG TPA: hypothetical protein VG102_03190 [Candidatus Paceibacterota bacterium]|jgi:hypothetical protein|nr:hypothetical protein [Candidatus Paceibacterota bacterium]
MDILVSCPLLPHNCSQFREAERLVLRLEHDGHRVIAPFQALDRPDTRTSDAVAAIRAAEMQLLSRKAVDEVRFVEPLAANIQGLIVVAVNNGLWDFAANRHVEHRIAA